jgi:hypothetical protein
MRYRVRSQRDHEGDGCCHEEAPITQRRQAVVGVDSLPPPPLVCASTLALIDR